MDMTSLRALATVLVMIGFFAVVWWAYGPSRKKRFEEDAKLPFADDAEADPSAGISSTDKDSTGDHRGSK
jgi:cytochrome c oxidase cbb3-type subunit IV